MEFRNFLSSSTFTRIVLLIWLVSSSVIGVLLYDIDLLVNKELYNYGLKFDIAWASSYWNLMHLIVASIAIPALLSGIILFSVSRRKNLTNKSPTLIVNDEGLGRKHQSKEDVQVLIRCPNCKKVFSRPLIILDFANGRAKSVNVCPYCNKALSDSEESQERESTIQTPRNQETTQALHDNPPSIEPKEG